MTVSPEQLREAQAAVLDFLANCDPITFIVEQARTQAENGAIGPMLGAGAATPAMITPTMQDQVDRLRAALPVEVLDFLAGVCATAGTLPAVKNIPYRSISEAVLRDGPMHATTSGAYVRFSRNFGGAGDPFGIFARHSIAEVYEWAKAEYVTAFAELDHTKAKGEGEASTGSTAPLATLQQADVARMLRREMEDHGYAMNDGAARERVSSACKTGELPSQGQPRRRRIREAEAYVWVREVVKARVAREDEKPRGASLSDIISRKEKF